jgi:iron complex transport system substrate-binding protein
MDFALVLGLQMAAGSALFGAPPEDYPEYQRATYPDVLDDLDILQTDPANYEQIAAYTPDCILDSGSSYDRDRYEQLSQIAPTFVFSTVEQVEGLSEGREVWREPLQAIGRAFGRVERAEQFLATFDARAEEMKRRMAERWKGATFAIVDLGPENIYLAGTVQDPASQILFGDLGVAAASLVTPAARYISLELVPELDADVLLVGMRWQEGSIKRDLSAEALYVKSPLWQRLPAVQKNQVYRFNSEIGYTTPLCAQAFLEYVERTLLA